MGDHRSDDRSPLPLPPPPEAGEPTKKMLMKRPQPEPKNVNSVLGLWVSIVAIFSVLLGFYLWDCR